MPPWDKYQEAEAPTTGPWMKYQQQETPPVESPPPPSLSKQDYKRGALETIAGHPGVRLALGAASPFIAAWQAGTHVGDVINRMTGYEPMVSQGTDKALAELEAAKQRGMGGGFDWMGLAGSAVSGGKIAKEVGSQLPRGAALLPRMKEGAKVGAIVSATQPVVGQDFWTGKPSQVVGGASIGGSLPALGDILSKGVEMGYNFMQPVLDLFRKEGPKHFLNRYMREAVGEQHVPKVQGALNRAQPLVRGSEPTASEAVAKLPEGSPIQAAQKITAETPGGPSAKFAERMNAQVAARAKALDTIAPGVSEKAAVATRDVVSKKAYERAFNDVVMGDTKLRLLMKRPSMEVAMKHAQRLASEQNESAVFGQNMPAHTATSTILGPNGQPITTQVPAQVATYPVKTLHYLKMALDDMVRDPEKFGIAKTEQRAINETRKSLVNWIAKKSPAYNDARLLHQQLSQVVNRTQIRDLLKEKLTNPTGTESPGVYLRAVDDAAKSMKTATGYPRFHSLTEAGLTKPEAKAVHDVARDLERHLSSLKPTQRTNLQGGVNVSKEVMPHLPSLLSRPIVISNWLLSHLGKSNIEPKIDQLATQLYLNPQMLSQALAAQPGMNPQTLRMLQSLGPAAIPPLATMYGRQYQQEP